MSSGLHLATDFRDRFPKWLSPPSADVFQALPNAVNYAGLLGFLPSPKQPNRLRDRLIR